MKAERPLSPFEAGLLHVFLGNPMPMPGQISNLKSTIGLAIRPDKWAQSGYTEEPGCDNMADTRPCRVPAQDERFFAIARPPDMLQLRPILMLIAISSPLVGADALLRYIQPEHPVELHQEISEQSRVLGFLSTNEAVKLLKQNTKTGHAQIERSNGQTGWVLAKDLADTPKTLTGAQAAARSAQASKSAEALKSELSQLQAELVNLRASSVEILKIQAERDQLQSTVIRLKREIETLNQERSGLAADQKQAWFLVGGAVLFIGIFLGVVLPRLSDRRSSHWGSF